MYKHFQPKIQAAITMDYNYGTHRVWVGVQIFIKNP